MPVTVTVEIEWVLRSRDRLDRQEILTALTAQLETRKLCFEAEGTVERALHLYREHGGDFADYLHVGQSGAASNFRPACVMFARRSEPRSAPQAAGVTRFADTCGSNAVRHG